MRDALRQKAIGVCDPENFWNGDGLSFCAVFKTWEDDPVPSMQPDTCWIAVHRFDEIENAAKVCAMIGDEAR